MNLLQTIFQRIVKFSLLLMMGWSMSACSGDTKWKEEVQLNDGRVIVVEREILTEGGGDEWALNRSMSKPKEYRLRFEHPGVVGKLVDWHSTKLMRTWPEKPLVLDVENGAPVVFSDFFNLAGCHIYINIFTKRRAGLKNHFPRSLRNAQRIY